MSDEPFPYQPKPLMSAIRARNLSRRYKAFAEHLHASGYGDEALQMEHTASNLKNDSEYKRGLLRFEPWKIVLGGFLSGAATLGAIVGLLTFILRHG